MKFILIPLLLFTSACHSEQAPGENEAVTGQAAGSDLEVLIEMEGKTYRMDNINWVNSTVTEVEDEIRFYLTQDDSPVTVNLNMKQNAVGASGANRFKLPDTNRPNMVIELSFFQPDRPVSRMKRRLVFSEGTIDILEYGPNTLRMTFQGMGNQLMDAEQFPMEGSINIEF